MSIPRKLKRVVIKEELVALTKNHVCALILNQFLYWSERTDDTDKFLKEEISRNRNLDVELLHGWVYKKADELASELMLDVNATTIRRYITKLVDLKLLLERHNPLKKYDRTMQYRPNILEIQKQLQDLGYALEGYPLYPSAGANLQNADSNLQNADSNLQNADSNLQNADSNLQNAGAIPEITSETTSKITCIEEEAATEKPSIVSTLDEDKQAQSELQRIAYDWRSRPWMESAERFKPEMVQAVWQCNVDWYSLEGSKTPNLKKISDRLKKLDGKLKALDSNALDAYKQLQDYWVVAQAITNPEVEQAFNHAAIRQKQQRTYSSIEQALQKPEGSIF